MKSQDHDSGQSAQPRLQPSSQVVEIPANGLMYLQNVEIAAAGVATTILAWWLRISRCSANHCWNRTGADAARPLRVQQVTLAVPTTAASRHSLWMQTLDPGASISRSRSEQKGNRRPESS